MVFIGPLCNLCDLLTSEPDRISPLTGVELIKQSAETIYVMGGHFGSTDIAEWNIQMDVRAAQTVTELCPVPIVYCGYEAGEAVITGTGLDACDAEYPVRMAYSLYADGKGRSSWDLVTVYYALEPNLKNWICSEECQIRFRDDGSAALTEGCGGRYIRYADESEIQAILDGIIQLTTEL